MLDTTSDLAGVLAGLIKPPVAAQYIGVSLSAINKGRIGLGPLVDLPFVRIGTAIRYRRVDLDAWIERHLTNSSPAGAR